MNSLKKISVLLLASMVFATAQAQPGKQPAKTPTIKFKPPKVKTYWGRNSDSAWVTREEAKQLIGIPIRITDIKNVAYKITSYQFAYKAIIVTEDEATGKVLPSTELKSDRFTTSPLPQLWQDNIRRTLKEGEMLYFFDVLVKDDKGRNFYAPELKVYIR